MSAFLNMGGIPPGIDAGFWYLLSHLIIHEKTIILKEESQLLSWMPDMFTVEERMHASYIQWVSFKLIMSKCSTYNVLELCKVQAL